MKRIPFARPRLRQPEYTGRNRCIPCTVVNSVIGAGLALTVALWSRPAAVVTAVVALGLIYFRGYLVPGTPTVTKRYMPEWLLAWFGKGPTQHPDGEFDPGTVLSDAGLLGLTADGSDVRLDPTFASAWAGRTHELLTSGSADERAALAAFLDVSPDGLLVARGDEGVSAHLDGEFVGSWPSRTAFFADMAGNELLAPALPGWEELNVARRTELTSTLRLFAESCPRCGGPIALDEEYRDSCCSTYEVITANCTECGTRVLELPVSDAMREAMAEEGGAT